MDPLRTSALLCCVCQRLCQITERFNPDVHSIPLGERVREPAHKHPQSQCIDCTVCNNINKLLGFQLSPPCIVLCRTLCIVLVVEM